LLTVARLVTLFSALEAILVSALATDFVGIDILSSLNDDMTFGARSDLVVTVDVLTLVMTKVLLIN